jgi:hypothetical protein
MTTHTLHAQSSIQRDFFQGQSVNKLTIDERQWQRRLPVPECFSVLALSLLYVCFHYTSPILLTPMVDQ